MKEYRKRPLRIKAVKLTVENAFEVCRMIPSSRLILSGPFHAMETDTPLALVLGKGNFAEVGSTYVYQDNMLEWNSIDNAVFENNYEEVE